MYVPKIDQCIENKVILERVNLLSNLTPYLSALEF